MNLAFVKTNNTKYSKIAVRFFLIGLSFSVILHLIGFLLLNILLIDGGLVNFILLFIMGLTVLVPMILLFLNYRSYAVKGKVRELSFLAAFVGLTSSTVFCWTLYTTLGPPPPSYTVDFSYLEAANKVVITKGDYSSQETPFTNSITDNQKVQQIIQFFENSNKGWRKFDYGLRLNVGTVGHLEFYVGNDSIGSFRLQGNPFSDNIAISSQNYEYKKDFKADEIAFFFPPNLIPGGK